MYNSGSTNKNIPSSEHYMHTTILLASLQCSIQNYVSQLSYFDLVQQIVINLMHNSFFGSTSFFFCSLEHFNSVV